MIELLIVKTIVRNGSLWSKVVFYAGGKFSLKQLNSSGLKPLTMHLKAHKLVQQVCFFFDCSLADYCMHMLRYTKWEYWSLTITTGAKAKIANSVYVLMHNTQKSP